MAGVVTHARDLVDQGADSRQRPKFGFVTLGLWSAEQGFHHSLASRGIHPRLATGLAFTGKRRFASRLPRLFPAVTHLTGDAQPPRHLGAGIALFKQTRRPKPTLLHLGVISLLAHATFNHLPTRMSLYYARLNIFAHRPPKSSPDSECFGMGLGAISSTSHSSTAYRVSREFVFQVSYEYTGTRNPLAPFEDSKNWRVIEPATVERQPFP